MIVVVGMWGFKWRPMEKCFSNTLI